MVGEDIMNKKKDNKKDLKLLNRITYQHGVEFRKLVREHIIPELIEAIEDNDFRDGLKEALGITELEARSYSDLNRFK